MPDDVELRLTAALYKAAELLLLHGATPSEVDEAMVAGGMKMGVFEAQDLSGLDNAYHLRKNGLEERYPHLFGLAISDRMVMDGKLGKKLNAGWYRYPGGKGKVEDPIVEDLVAEESWFAGIERQHFDADTIRNCLSAAIILEAHRVLETCEGQDVSRMEKELMQLLPFCDPGHSLTPGDESRMEFLIGIANKWAHSDNAFWSLPTRIRSIAGSPEEGLKP